MFAADQYQLLDFGDGRKLEQFGEYILDRPSPAAEGQIPSDRRAWAAASARYERTQGDAGIWIPSDSLSATWNIAHGRVTFELKPTSFGHIGVFPEQAALWDWIAASAAAAERPLEVLNLFAYTGGSTLAAAAVGAHVVHVDSAENTVAWARRNAAASGLADAPIRWIVEDAMTFVRREVKRGRRYDAAILDPPSYGHGPKGQVWKLESDLSSLLAMCAELTQGDPRLLLLTCHTPGFGPEALASQLAAAFGSAAREIVADSMSIPCLAQGSLPCGAMARFCVRQHQGSAS